MNYAPIVLFTYNRPFETKVTIDSILTNPECKGSVLYIFSDAAKNEESKKKVEDVRKVLHSIRNEDFLDIRIIEQTENQGLAKSIISGVKRVFEEFDRIIVLEDDCEVSPYFLNYMNLALEKYRTDMTVGSISAFSPKLRNAPKDDVYAVLRSCSMSWACWKSIWERVDFDVKDYKALRHDRTFIHSMNRAGNDRMYRFIRQVKFNLQSWSIRFGADLTRRGLLTIYPKYSYVKNIGLEAGGVHSSKDAPEALKVDNDQAIKNPVFPDHINADLIIEKEFRRIYGGRLLNRIKRSLYVYLGEGIIDYVRK